MIPFFLDNLLRDVLSRFCSSYSVLQIIYCFLFELDHPTDSPDGAPLSGIQAVD